MKIYIFGTGYHYRRILKYMNEDDILALIDNDKEKQNTFINGKKVISPEKANFELCDFVVIFVYFFDDIYKQLIDFGVPKDKILHYKKIGDKIGLTLQIEFENKFYMPDKFLHNNNNVFLGIHEFSRTGVPVAVMNTALLLREMGYNVVMGAMSEGNLVSELKENKLPYVGNLEIFSEDQWRNFVSKFSFVILGTTCVAEFGNAIAYSNIPIIWWLNESNEATYQYYKLPAAQNNIHYYAGGKRVYNIFSRFYPGVKIEELLYFLPDDIVRGNKRRNVKFKFALIAYFEMRKAQDVFITAIEKLPLSLREKAEFIMVGDSSISRYGMELSKKKEHIPQLILLGEVSQTELKNVFDEIDVLVCPSRDDPMPIVVTQAMQHGIPCVVSNQVGQAEYINHMENGIVVEAGNADALAEAMRYCMENPEKILLMGEASKRIFQENFSENRMREKLRDIIDSVYNAEGCI